MASGGGGRLFGDRVQASVDWGGGGLDWGSGRCDSFEEILGGRDLMICTDRLFDDCQTRPDDVTLRAKTPLRP